jgi:adenosylcobyric acid synthase
MLQGTSSHVGKSIVATALCRIFAQEGRKVAPFKAQNMALNSYVTKEGLEMGRAQVAQAEAARLEPQVDMNPVLLKPTGNSCSQVIIQGKPLGNMSAREYHTGYALTAFTAVKDSLKRLAQHYDTIVIEGAGSPAEVNLKDHDIVNMRVAKYVQAPVLLVADVDRGGSLAAVVGTLELLDEDERELVKGVIINKFRGDVSLFRPAVDFLEQKTGKPVLGVVPFIEDLGIDDEDSVSLDDKQVADEEGTLQIAVMQLPKISNFTDFDSLAAEPDVSLHYVRHSGDLGHPDVIILPGSKNTIEDMQWLRSEGWEDRINEALAQGIPVIGICGGYQMLGRTISDPQHSESADGSVAALGLLDMTTTFAAGKLTSQIKASCTALPFLGQSITADSLTGYEIHMGQSVSHSGAQPIRVTQRFGRPCQDVSSTARNDGLVWGTYIHGIFDNDMFRRAVLNALRIHKGWQPIGETYNFYREKEKSYDRLAQVVQQHLRMELLHRIMGGGES